MSSQSVDCTTNGCSTSSEQSTQVSVMERFNATLQTFPCPLEFKKFFCLNNSNCFVIKIEGSRIYNCECTEGYVGQRCEFKNLNQSYLQARYNAMLQQASLTSAFIIVLVLIILFILFLYIRRDRQRRRKERRAHSSHDFTEVINYEAVVQLPEESNLPFSKPM